MYSPQCVLDLLLGFSFQLCLETCTGGCPGSILTKYSNPLILLFLIWRSSSILSSSSNLGHPPVQTHFSCLYLKHHIFCHYVKLMTICEGWNVDQPWTPVHHDRPIQCLQYNWHCINLPVHFTLYFSITCKQRPEILNLISLGQELTPTETCNIPVRIASTPTVSPIHFCFFRYSSKTW